MNDAYLSYAREDREIAARLVAFLQSRRVAVWWDALIPPASVFARVLEEQLDASERVIVLWSKSSVKSVWVNNEARRGVERKIIVPVLIEAVELPLEFNHLQAISLVDWIDEQHPALTQLLDAVPGRSRRSSQEESLGSVVLFGGFRLRQGRERAEPLRVLFIVGSLIVACLIVAATVIVVPRFGWEKHLVYGPSGAGGTAGSKGQAATSGGTFAQGGGLSPAAPDQPKQSMRVAVAARERTAGSGGQPATSGGASAQGVGLSPTASDQQSQRVAVAVRDRAATQCAPPEPGTWTDPQVQALNTSGKERLAVANKLPEGPERRDEAKRAEELSREVDERIRCLPPNVVRLGQSLEMQGRYLDAMREYRRILDAKASLGKHPFWKDSIRQAEELAASLEGRTPAVVVVLDPSHCDRPTALLDGIPVVIGARTSVDPGPHTVTATAGGCTNFRYTAEVRPGDTTRVTIHLTKPSEHVN